jgi:hypothetical protein
MANSARRQEQTRLCVTRKSYCLIIIEGRFQVCQRFSSSKLVLKAVESCFVALNYCGNGTIV